MWLVSGTALFSSLSLQPHLGGPRLIAVLGTVQRQELSMGCHLRTPHAEQGMDVTCVITDAGKVDPRGREGLSCS